VTVDAGYTAAGSFSIFGPFSFVAGTCANFVGPGTCTVSGTFNPSAIGAINDGNVDIAECPAAGGNCYNIQVPLTGNGVETFATNPGLISFGTVPVGSTSAPQQIAVTVDAGYNTEGFSVFGPFSFVEGTCANFVGPGTCTVSGTFTPTTTGAVTDGDVDIAECPTAGGACINLLVFLTGNVAAQSFAASPSSIHFGDVPINTTSAAQQLTLTVDAGYRASAAGTFGPFSVSQGTCASFVGPGTCTVSAAFTPTAIGAVNDGNVDVAECPAAGGNCINIQVPLIGNGVPTFATSPGFIQFGSVPVGGTSAPQQILVTVDAGYTTEGFSIFGPFSFSEGSCANFTGPGICFVSGTFTPTAVGDVTDGDVDIAECPAVGGTCLNRLVFLAGNGRVTPFPDE
jgi:hypothetical protein